MQDIFSVYLEEAERRFLLPAIAEGVMHRRRYLVTADALNIAPFNVHGIGIGYKVIGNHTTDRLAVRFHVIQKLPDVLVPPANRLPDSIGDMPTDVVESSPPLLGAVSIRRKLDPCDPGDCGPQGGSCPDEARKCYQPLMGGIAIGHPDLTGQGTLAWFCKSTMAGEESSRFLLSARHVLALFDGDHIGEPVLQPQIGSRSVAKVHRVTPLLTGSDNVADAGIARLLDNNVTEIIKDLGRPTACVAPQRNMRVVKRGVGTLRPVGHGIITDYPYLTPVELNKPDGTICPFKNQIRIQSTTGHDFVDGGDSGALVMREDDLAPVGLLFALAPSDGTIGYANPIGAVLDALKIQLL